MTNPSFNDDTRIKGDTDETLIGNIGDRLKVTADAATFTNKYRIDYSMVPIVLGSSYVTIFSYTGSGKFVGSLLDFDSDNTEVKFTIDSTEVVYELILVDLQMIFHSAGDFACGQIRVQSGSRLEFCPSIPIPYNSSLKIEARKTSGPDKNLNESLVFLTKDT